jgi:hypothetical protein
VLLFHLLKRYNPNQPRDRNGRWGSGGASQVDISEAPQSTRRDARGIPMPPDTSKWGPAAARPKRQMAELYQAAQRGDTDAIRGTSTTRSNTYARTVDDYKTKLIGHFEEDGQVVTPPPPPPRPPRRVKPKEKTLDEMDVYASRRTDDERMFNRMAFANADPELKELVATTPPVRVERNANAGRAWCRPGVADHTPAAIEMSRFDAMTNDGQVVWAHEMGHQIDGSSSQSVKHRFASMNSRSGYAAIADRNKIFDSSETRYSLQSEMNRPVGQEKIMVADFFGAMTMNRIGYGHSDAYYKQGRSAVNIYERQYGEMFANYIALRSQNGDGYKIIRKYAPETVKEFDAVVKKSLAYNRKRHLEDPYRVYKTE